MGQMRGSHDHFRLGDLEMPETDTIGVYVIIGVARHYSTSQIGDISVNGDSGWKFPFVSDSGAEVGGNYGRGDKPKFWDLVPAGGEATHTLALSWCYCNGSEHHTTTVTPE